MSIRITGGALGGRNISSPRSDKTRPTSSLTRQAIFNILGDVQGWDILDTYAGTGILGIEAMSRGARSLVSIEKNAAQAKSIQLAFQSLNLQNAEVVCSASLDYSARLSPGSLYDLVYADPPFTELYPDLRPLLALVREQGWAIFECPSRNVPQWKDSALFPLHDLRRYGESTLLFFRNLPVMQPLGVDF